MSHHSHHQRHAHPRHHDADPSPGSTDTPGVLSHLQLPLGAHVTEVRHGNDGVGVVVFIDRGKDEGAEVGMIVTFTSKDGSVIGTGIIEAAHMDSRVFIEGRDDPDTFIGAHCTLGRAEY
jgi:hypothetical protein